MLRFNKQKLISASLNKEYKEIITFLYVSKEYSAREISEYIYDKSKVTITPRSIQRDLTALGLIRTYADAFKIAIKRGTKSYDKLRKKIKSSDLRHGISIKTRYNVFKRDNYRCTICGSDAKTELLVIDHITPVVKGGNNEIRNLRTLCRTCNHGKMLSEEKI